MSWGETYEEVVAVIEGADRVREPLGRVRREVVDVLERAVVLEQPFDELVVLFSLRHSIQRSTAGLIAN